MSAATVVTACAAQMPAMPQPLPVHMTVGPTAMTADWLAFPTSRKPTTANWSESGGAFNLWLTGQLQGIGVCHLQPGGTPVAQISGESHLVPRRVFRPS